LIVVAIKCTKSSEKHHITMNGMKKGKTIKGLLKGRRYTGN
jgi:hypothetical protein